MIAYFARQILIFYKDASWKDKIYNEIIESYGPAGLIHKSQTNNHESLIYFVDGTSVSILPYDTTRRACRGSEIYMQSGIPKRYYDENISIRLLEPGEHVYIIDSCCDICAPIWTRRAEVYYKNN